MPYAGFCVYLEATKTFMLSHHEIHLHLNPTLNG